HVCRPHSQGRKAGRPPGPAADQVRAGDQPQAGQSAGARRAADAAAERRRGDRVMKRRDFIALLGAAAAWPLTARGQEKAVPVMGYLYLGSTEESTSVIAAFRKGLSEAGYIEGRDVAIEYRFANSVYARLPELAADLVRRRVAAIATSNLSPGLAAKA